MKAYKAGCFRFHSEIVAAIFIRRECDVFLRGGVEEGGGVIWRGFKMMMWTRSTLQKCTGGKWSSVCFYVRKVLQGGAGK